MVSSLTLNSATSIMNVLEMSRKKSFVQMVFSSRLPIQTTSFVIILSMSTVGQENMSVSTKSLSDVFIKIMIFAEEPEPGLDARCYRANGFFNHEDPLVCNK